MPACDGFYIFSYMTSGYIAIEVNAKRRSNSKSAKGIP